MTLGSTWLEEFWERSQGESGQNDRLSAALGRTRRTCQFPTAPPTDPRTAALISCGQLLVPILIGTEVNLRKKYWGYSFHITPPGTSELLNFYPFYPLGPLNFVCDKPQLPTGVVNVKPGTTCSQGKSCSGLAPTGLHSWR